MEKKQWEQQVRQNMHWQKEKQEDTRVAIPALFYCQAWSQGCRPGALEAINPSCKGSALLVSQVQDGE